MVCLDTDFLVGYLRADLAVRKKIQELKSRRESLYVTTISAVELYRGAFRSKNPGSEAARVKKLIDGLLTLTLDHDSAKMAGEIDSKIKSNPVEPADLLIAAIAVANKQTLLTRNVKHFERVPGLAIESW